MDTIASVAKAIAGGITSAIVVAVTNYTGLAVPMEWETAATVGLVGVITGFFTWLIPNKQVTT